MPEHWHSPGAAIVGASQAELEIVTRQKEVGMLQDGKPLMVYSTTTQLLDASRAHTGTSPRHSISLNPVVDLNENHIPGGTSLNGCDSRQRDYRDEPHLWKLESDETVHGGHLQLVNEKQAHVLTYPPGEVNAVRITDKDMESLQPGSWLRDNIIDFYIMYLERNKHSIENKNVYFFNSFFYRKLVESTAQGKIGYEQVRNWTKDVNLFEKKFIFIPVNDSSHWSLIIICNLDNLSYEQRSSPCILHLDSLKGRYLHDIVEPYNRNARVETFIREYIIEAWKETYQAGSDDRLGSLYSMMFLQAEVPQQDNGYDCGLYLLHYIELFLQQIKCLWDLDLVLILNNPFTNRIPGLWFESSEVSMKRKDIEHVIRYISDSEGDKALIVNGTEYVQKKGIGSVQYVSAQCAATKPAHDQAAVELTVPNREGFPITSLSRPRRDKRKRDSNWSDEETSILVKCKKEAAVDIGSRFCKGKPDVANWDAIAEEINRILGTMSISKTGDQCRLRWDTLVKSYKRIKEHCKGSNKDFSDLTRKERVDLKLATTLSNVEWYEVIDRFCPPKSRKSKSQKVDNVVPNVDTHSSNVHHSTHNNSPMQAGFGYIEARESSAREADAMQDIAGFSTVGGELNPVAFDPPVQIEIGSLEPQEPPGKEVVIPGWSVTNGAFNPVGSGSPLPTQSPVSESRESSQKQVAIPRFHSMSDNLKSTILNLVQAWPGNSIRPNLEKVCRWLAIVQDRSPSETRSYVFKLLKLNLLTTSSGYEGACRLKLSRLRVYKRFAKVVTSKNLNYNIHSRILKDNSVLSFASSSAPQRIRVLTLYKCVNLENVDLGNLPMLRSLCIQGCVKLKEILGWENLSNLGWLKIHRCHDLYDEHLRVHCLPSLKEFSFIWCNPKSERDYSTGFELDFSQCVRLRKVKITLIQRPIKSVDLSTLKFLESLTFSDCPHLESVVGWSELHSLTELTFDACPALDKLPYNLGDLTALTKLELDYSSSETILGVENLHSLTHLKLRNRSALRRLPDFGGLKALTYLWLQDPDVDEIRGLDKLLLLTHLTLFICEALRWLPYLGHLKALAHLSITGCGVDDIPGVRELVNLETLTCWYSQLEWLPDLGHLPRLKRVVLCGTPLVRVPLSKYYGKSTVLFNEGVKWEEEATDVIDPDYIPSDQEVYDEDVYYEGSFGASDG